MKCAKGQKEATKQRILECASCLLREDGIDALCLKAVMRKAGLTLGGFYFHFESRDDLVRQALEHALNEQKAELAMWARPNLEAAIRKYLVACRRGEFIGCPAAAPLAEVARQPKATRVLYTTKVEEVIDLLALQMTDGDAGERRQRAWSVFALMAGGLALARAVSEPSISAEILEGALNAVLGIFGISSKEENAQARRFVPLDSADAPSGSSVA